MPGMRLRRLLFRAAEALAIAFAMAGGLLLLLLAAVTVYAVIGLALAGQPQRAALPVLAWFRPFIGESELVGLLIGVAVAAMLPYAQVRRAHIAVTFASERLPQHWRHRLRRTGDLLLAGLAALLAARLWAGAAEARLYGDQTMILRWPVWWAMAAIAACLAVLALASLATALAPDDKATGRRFGVRGTGDAPPGAA